MILSYEDLMKAVKSRVTGTSDEDIAFLENFDDTIKSMQDTQKEDWKSKYEENDKQWREKYIARFESGGTKESPLPPTTPQDLPPEPEPDPLQEVTIDNLFK